MDGVRTVFFRARLESSEVLALVEYADGTLGILKEGQPVDGCRWKPGELRLAVSGFTDLQHRLHKTAQS